MTVFYKLMVSKIVTHSIDTFVHSRWHAAAVLQDKHDGIIILVMKYELSVGEFFAVSPCMFRKPL